MHRLLWSLPFLLLHPFIQERGRQPSYRPPLKLQVGERLSAESFKALSGDELVVRRFYNNRRQEEVKVRLRGVDAPEREQRFFEEARRYLAERTISGIRVVEVKKDGWAFVDAFYIQAAKSDPENSAFLFTEPNLNESLIRAGLAWWDRQPGPQAKDYEDIEWVARHYRRGLWADDKPIPPWKWRKRLAKPTGAKRPRKGRLKSRRKSRPPRSLHP